MNLIQNLLNLNKSTKVIIAIGLDVFALTISNYLSFVVRADSFAISTGPFLLATSVSIFIAIPIFFYRCLYKEIFRYTTINAFVLILKAIGLYAFIYLAALYLIGDPSIPKFIWVIQPVIVFLILFISRLLIAKLISSMQRPVRRNYGIVSKNILIYGAGDAGQQLFKSLQSNSQVSIVGFIDDDPSLHLRVIFGLPIYSPSQIDFLIASRDVDTVLLAMPSASRRRRADIIKLLLSKHLFVRSMPGLLDLAFGRSMVSDLNEIDISDLLGRGIAKTSTLDLSYFGLICGGVVMVTGAGGSIGSELSRQIALRKPSALILLDSSEYALYKISSALEELYPEIVIHSILGTVCDQVHMERVFNLYAPHLVFHAAAYKHVPLVEKNIIEGARNNILGTTVMAQLSASYGVNKFVLISTDKAVRPIGVMGATKRFSEMVVQAVADNAKITNFSIVRFGNVLDSSGSVVPKFKQQIKEGGPVTVTHPEVTRYFMSIPEAVLLVLETVRFEKTGCFTYLFDMGEAIKISDLAKNLIELSGLTVRDINNPHGDIEIIFNGLRAGEKLHEELLLSGELSPTSNGQIMEAVEPKVEANQVMGFLKELELVIAKQDEAALLEILSRAVDGYEPSTTINV